MLSGRASCLLTDLCTGQGSVMPVHRDEPRCCRHWRSVNFYVSHCSITMCISYGEIDTTNQCFESWLGTYIIISSRWRKAQLSISVQDGSLEDPYTVCMATTKSTRRSDCWWRPTTPPLLSTVCAHHAGWRMSKMSLCPMMFQTHGVPWPDWHVEVT